MEAGGDACWLTRRVKEVKRFVGLGQPLDSPWIELDSRPTRMLLADEPVADCVDPPAWCRVPCHRDAVQWIAEDWKPLAAEASPPAHPAAAPSRHHP